MFDFNIYQNKEFLKIIEDVYQIEKVAIFNDNKFNGLTTFYKAKNRKSDIFNMPFNFYYSPIIASKIENKYFNELKEYSKKNKINIIMKSLNYYEKIDTKQLYANNPIIELSEDYTMRFSKNLKQNLKRNYNKANKNNIVIVQSYCEKDLIEFYNDVLSIVYIDKHKMLFQPLELFVKLLKKKKLEMFIAKQDNIVIGGLLCIKDTHTLHYNWGASLIVENIALGTLLIEYAIKYAYQNSYAYFDMGSTSLSDEKLFDFKMRWGATNYKVYEYYTLAPPTQIDLNNSYKLARNIYSKFPKLFLRWLMPKIIPWLVQ
jgi:hypothetical protein